MASVPCLSLQGSPSLAGLLGNRVLALSGSPRLSVWPRPQICWGPAGKALVFQGSEASSSQPCPPGSSLRPQADGNQDVAYTWSLAATGPEVPYSSPSTLQSPPCSLERPKRPETGMAGRGPLGEPRVPPQRLPALGLISQWLLSPERGAGLPVAREVMSQAPGAWSGRSEAKIGVAKTRRGKGAEPPPHDHLMSR